MLFGARKRGKMYAEHDCEFSMIYLFDFVNLDTNSCRYEPTEPTADEIEEARTVRRMINRELGEDGDSDEISEDEGIFDKAGVADEVDEEEELIEREQELQAELNFATQRCQELQRTLQETKSFIGAHGIPLPSKMSGIGIEKPGRKPAASTIESADGADSDYEENFDLDESVELGVSRYGFEMTAVEKF